MSNTTEMWEQDRDWLLDNLPDASENVIEYFCERVSVFTCDAKMDDETARNRALELTKAYITSGTGVFTKTGL